MAGSIRPNQYMLEANYNFIGGLGSQGSQAKGLFNGSAVNEWNTANVMYWAGGNEYVEFEVFNNFHIWRAGTTGWNNLCNSLKIKKYNSQTLVYEDVTINYPQKLTAITEKQWEKTISNLPKGKYRVEYGTGGRIDSEWFLENSEVNKTLILSNIEYKKYYKYIEPKDNITLVPKMTSNTIPSGIVDASSYYTSTNTANPYKAFNGTTLGDNGWDGWTPIGTTGWLSYDFGFIAKVNSYSIRPLNFNLGVNRSPKNWTFEGSNNGTVWDVLDTRTNINNWVLETTKYFKIETTAKYRMYRLNITANNGETFLSIGLVEMFYSDKSVWSTVSSSLPNSTQFIEQGMDNLSPLLDRTVTELEPMPMTNKIEILGVGDVGKVFSKSIDLKKYFDIRSVKVEVK